VILSSPRSEKSKNHQQKPSTKPSSTMNKKELWQKILHLAITILTAIATTLGTTSCIGA